MFSWKCTGECGKTAEILNQQNYGSTYQSTRMTISFCCLSSQNSLSFSFSQYKISLWNRDLSSLLALAKIIASSQYKRWQKKKYFYKILYWQITNTDSDLESARATLCKLATCSRQTFLLAKQAETIRNWSKTDFGYDYKHCSHFSEERTN